MFQYKTRGGRSPQGLQKVYFTCHPEDHERLFAEWSDRILKEANCAVYYNTSEGEYEDIETDLGEMQLFFIPVTTKLLTEESRCLSADLPFALSHHKPVLPLLMEDGIDDLYKKHFGDAHYLSPFAQDDTAISFDEKFKKYIASVILNDETAAKVRKAFDAYIFLSYRKKDRALAQKLMRLIHKNAFCRDIAIWYDEFLNPGEDFTAAIDHALEMSKLFALVVTPSLLEKNDRGEENFVKRIEYPRAKDAGKKILPAEMAKTDGGRLAGDFPGIESTIDCGDEGALSAALHDALAAAAKAENDDDPEHNFFIGLAYLGGIDVETDYEKALELITFAAEHGVSQAVEKLVAMYENGEGVERDYKKAIEWQRKLAELYEKRAETAPGRRNCLDLLIAVWDLGDKLNAVGDPKAAEKEYRRMHELCESYSAELEGSYRRYLSISLSNLGDIRKALGDLNGAEKFYSRSLEIDEQLASEAETIEARRDLSFSLDNLGDIRKALGDLNSAEKYYSRSFEIREQLARETGTIKARRDLSISMNKLGGIRKALGDLNGAEKCYARALEIREQLAKETGTIEARRDLSISLTNLGIIRKALGDLNGAEKYYSRSLEISEQLASETETIEARRDLSFSLEKLGDVRKALGDLNGAEKYYSRSLEIRAQLAKETGTIEARRDLSVSLNRLGDIRKALGDLNGAEKYYSRALEIREQLAKETETIEARRDLSFSLEKLGDVRKALGDLNGAEKYYSRSLEISEQLAMDTGTIEARRDLLVSLEKLGGVRKDKGDLEGAAKYYSRSVEIREQLNKETCTVRARNDLTYSLINKLVSESLDPEIQGKAMVALGELGDASKESGNYRCAEECYFRSAEIAEQIAETVNTAEAWYDYYCRLNSLGMIRSARKNPFGAEEAYSRQARVAERIVIMTGSVKARHDYFLSLVRLGDARLYVYRISGDNISSAEESYSEAFTLAEQLVKDTGTVQARRDLSFSYEKLGDICDEKGDLAGAENCYSRSLEIREQLANETGTEQARSDLSSMLFILGNILKAQEKTEEAVECYSRAFRIDQQLADETGAPEAYDDLAHSLYKIATLQDPPDKSKLHEAYEIWSYLVVKYPSVQKYAQNRAYIARLLGIPESDQ